MKRLREQAGEGALGAFAVDGVEPEGDADDGPEEADEREERYRHAVGGGEDVEEEKLAALPHERVEVDERSPEYTDADEPQEEGETALAEVVGHLLPEERAHATASWK